MPDTSIEVRSIFNNLPFKYEQLNEFQAVLSGQIGKTPVAILIHDHHGKKDYSLYVNYDKDNPVCVGESEERIKDIITRMISSRTQ